MPFEFFLALRHLRSRRKRRLVRVTSLIAVVGIGVGLAALIVALALANGFRDELRDKILRNTAHLTVMRTDGQAMTDYRSVATKVAGIPGVTSASGTTYDGAVIVGPRASAYAVLRGIEVSPSTSQQLTQSLIAGSSDEIFAAHQELNNLPQVGLGSELAARTGLAVGDTAEVIPASAGLSSNQTRRRVRVAAVLRSGLFEYDSTWVYLPLETAGAISGEAHAATVISVQVADIYKVKAVTAKVRESLGSSYTAVDWQEANRPLFTALALERRIGIIIIGLIVFIAALNITTTLILVVVERRHDIAVLNALGATSRSIMSIFVIEGALVGLTGAAMGVLLGAIAIVIANRFQLLSLPADVYSISNVPLSLNLGDAALAALVAFVLSVVATIYPARAAARVRAAEMLRDV